MNRHAIGAIAVVERGALQGSSDKTPVECVVLDVHPGNPAKPANSYWVQPPVGTGEPKWVSAKRVQHEEAA